MTDTLSARTIPRKRAAAKLQRKIDAIQPLRCVAGFDRLVMLSREQIDPADLSWLREHCGKIKVHYHGQMVMGVQVNIPPHRERWTVFQPDREAKAYLARQHNTLHLSQCEIALNWIFASAAEVAEAFETTAAHDIMRHRSLHSVQWYVGKNGPSRYTSGRLPGQYDNLRKPLRKATVIGITYGDKSCPFTGARHCLHREYRISKPAPCDALGSIAWRTWPTLITGSSGKKSCCWRISTARN